MSNPAEKSPAHSAKRALTTPQAQATSAEHRPHSIVAHSVTPVRPDQRQSMIAEAAYYLALQRDFEPGHEVQDWLVAESHIDAALARGASSAQRS
jgi:hypothetical protein